MEISWEEVEILPVSPAVSSSEIYSQHTQNSIKSCLVCALFIDAGARSHGIMFLKLSTMSQKRESLLQATDRIPECNFGLSSLVPCALSDGDGNVVVRIKIMRFTESLVTLRLPAQLLTKVKSQHAVESIMRVVATEMGSSAALCCPPLTVANARDYGVTRSLSQAWRIGQAVASCRQRKCVAMFQFTLSGQLNDSKVTSNEYQTRFLRFRTERVCSLGRLFKFLGLVSLPPYRL